MTVSTDGQICFGMLLEADRELPWENYEDGDIDEWWLKVLNYEPPFKIYENGSYIGGISPPEGKITEYYKHKFAFRDAHPIPVTLVNYCSGDYPLYILAVPSSCKRASRGYPENFKPSELTVAQEEIDALLQFCADYAIEYEGEPQWWLSSFWG